MRITLGILKKSDDFVQNQKILGIEDFDGNRHTKPGICVKKWD